MAIPAACFMPDHVHLLIQGEDEATLSIARYIFENPLRARLVDKVEDYPFVGSTMFTTTQVLEAIQLGTWSST